MNTIIALLRILFGILLGIIGCIVLLFAPWQVADINFSFASNGPSFFISVILGALMLCGSWRLIRGRRVDSTVT
jgi:hypothetical protein